MNRRKIMSLRMSINSFKFRSKSDDSSSISSTAMSLEYWTKHNPLLIAEEIYYESHNAARGKLDFLISTMYYFLGLGNMWRFPIICLRNGGGSFLTVYIVINFLIGMPLLFLELYLSQFTSRGVAGCWQFAPGLRGIGYSMILVNLICCVCYSLVLGWILFYIINSLRLVLPFLTCTNPWNDKICIPALGKSANISIGEISSEQFWFRFVTTSMSYDGKTSYHIGTIPEKIVWYSCSCMMIAWTVSAVSITRGVKIAERWHMVFMVIPLLVIIGISLINLQLPGSFQGFWLYVIPNYKGVLNFKTWYYAVEQVFFSLGTGFGAILTIGSYNDFHENIQNLSFFICLLNIVTSFTSGMAIYLILGYMVNKYSLTPKSINFLANHGLIFFVYPECFANFLYLQFSIVIFYIMIFVQGVDSMFVMIQSVITGFVEIFPVIEETKYHRICFGLLLHFVCAIFTIIFVTNVGYSWFTLLEKYCLSVNLLIIGFLEICAISYVYGLGCVSRDCKMMISKRLNFVWKFLLFFISPLTILVLIIHSILHWKRTSLGHRFHYYVFPIWAEVVGWVVLLVILAPIPGYFINTVYKTLKLENISFGKSLHSALSPSIIWGPLKKRKWLLDNHYKDELRKLRRDSDYYNFKSLNTKHSTLWSKWLELSKSRCWEDYFSDKYIAGINENVIQRKNFNVCDMSDNSNREILGSTNYDANLV